MKIFMVNKKVKWLLVFFLTLTTAFFCVLVFQNEILSYLFKDKIWAHRVNSLEKFESASDKFPGVELDVVFLNQKEIFDVTHPPSPSIGLTLNKYLSSKKINKKYNFWIDFKNLNSNNYLASSQKLNNLADSLDLTKSNIIVESTKPEYLTYFSKNDFKTSYYLPVKLYKLKGQLLEDALKDTHDKIKISNPDFISASVSNYNIMKRDFPHKEILLWNVLNDPPNINSLYRFKIAIEKLLTKYVILKDNYVIVSLGEFNPDKGNR